MSLSAKTGSQRRSTTNKGIASGKRLVGEATDFYAFFTLIEAH